ncbi:unnamed protein product [Brachionus calyciflorus]|uniref:Ran-binding protein 9 n=1 Tax=Brachionus calyciflorus TaxID=104777 RepID=A0A813PZP5_9BILA|nr:unnamed protein product [Brachionus calyciflorus]
MSNSNPNGFNLNSNQNTVNTLLNTLNTNNNNSNPSGTSSSQIGSARVQTQSNPIPLSSSLPNNLSNRLLNNIISVSSLASSVSSSSSSSSSTVSNIQTSEKMDTSFTSNEVPNFSLNPSNVLSNGIQVGDVIARLYPNVNQNETPLPRQWSTDHKFQSLTLSHDNLRVTYKGPGKTHKDAASVRTDYPIPASCGIYYFEVKIISKGRDGYMGIGLSKSEVNLNRLPGWDKNSYGYHGDDGHSFCCSGTGQNYGPTFTTGDIIGCCLNLIENTCFYTKNGFNLGIAFRDLPSDLYPTVGLQTPMECVEANFGQYPFEYDIHNYVKEWHLKTKQSIEKLPLKKETENNMPTILRKLVSTYLVHHGYSATAEAFTKSVGHVFEEELASIRNRQRIQKSVLNGSIDESIELTYQLFPGILERNPNLLFALKVRQFIEMINNATCSNKSNEDEAMESSEEVIKNGHEQTENTEEKMETDLNNGKKTAENVSKKVSLDHDDANLKKILEYGRELFQHNNQFTNEQGENSSNAKMLRDAFSLLAYNDPWNSPMGYLLDSSQREPISALLNSAILEANNMPRIPPLEVVYGQTNECLRLMSKYGVAWCAYVNLNDYMHS